MVKNTKMQKFENRVLRSQPVTYDLENQQFRAVVKIHVRAKFHRAKCSGSWVIVVTEKKNSDENNTVRRYHGQ